MEMMEAMDANAKRETEKALHVLEGLISGIELDERIGDKELAEFAEWCESYQSCSSVQVFREVVSFVRRIIADGVVTGDELDTLRWLLDQFDGGQSYFDAGERETQRFIGFLHGIIADGALNDAEIRAIRAWFRENEGKIPVGPLRDVGAMLRVDTDEIPLSDAEREGLRSAIDVLIGHVP